MGQTGLADDTRAQAYANDIMASEDAFRRCFLSRDRVTAANRAVKLIADAALLALARIGVPAPQIVVADSLMPQGDKALYTAGSFRPAQWSIHVPIDLAHQVFDMLEIQGSEMRHNKLRSDPGAVRHVMASYAGTLIHESRHCEQVHRVARYVVDEAFVDKRLTPTTVLEGTTYVDFFQEKFVLSGPSAAPPQPMTVMKLLFPYIQPSMSRTPLTSQESDEALAWYHSMYGRTAAFHQVKRSTTDLKVYKSIPEEDDAYALQDMVHNILYVDWRLDAQDAQKYALQHVAIGA